MNIPGVTNYCGLQTWSGKKRSFLLDADAACSVHDDDYACYAKESCGLWHYVQRNNVDIKLKQLLFNVPGPVAAAARAYADVKMLLPARKNDSLPFVTFNATVASLGSISETAGQIAYGAVTNMVRRRRSGKLLRKKVKSISLPVPRWVVSQYQAVKRLNTPRTVEYQGGYKYSAPVGTKYAFYLGGTSEFPVSGATHL